MLSQIQFSVIKQVVDTVLYILRRFDVQLETAQPFPDNQL